MTPVPATEREIRDRLLAQLAERNTSGDLIAEEFRLDTGSFRIDVMQLGIDLVGYEIKSEQDTFARLANQLHAYNRVFDHLHLVCGPRHVDEAIRLLPSWWGILRADRLKDGSVTLTPLRPSKRNDRQEAFSLASLLWRDEALAVLQSANLTAPKKASSHLLWEQLASAVPFDHLRQAVVDTLSQRTRYSAAAVSAM